MKVTAVVIVVAICLVGSFAFRCGKFGSRSFALRAGGELPQPKAPRLNLVRGLLQGGAALVTLGIISQNMPRPVKAGSKYPIYADESVMSDKGHGTSAAPVQANLKWGCDNALADRICNFNRHWAENAGYWLSTSFVSDAVS